MVFVGGVYSAAISLAMVHALGGQINSVLLTMPSVVYTAGLSAAIHIINYYRHDPRASRACRFGRARA